jgi:nitrogen fixation/metabolism regulation signal transduction histidine kinase
MQVINEMDIMKLALQAILILVLGLVLWRIMIKIARNKNKTKTSSYFNTKYRDAWKQNK